MALLSLMSGFNFTDAVISFQAPLSCAYTPLSSVSSDDSLSSSGYHAFFYAPILLILRCLPVIQQRPP